MPCAAVPGLQPFLLGAQWPLGKCVSSFLLCHPLLLHQLDVLGWLVCAQEEVAGGRLGTFQTYLGMEHRKEGLPGALPAQARGSPLRRGLCSFTIPHPTQASFPGRPSPSSPGTSRTGTAPDGSLAWGQRPHCVQPWAGLRLGHTEPFCPHMGVGADATR